MTEVWRDIPGWEGFYTVSDRGQVRSVDRVVRMGNIVGNLRGKLLRQGTGRVGHRYVSLSVDGKPVKRYVHRLVLKAFVGPCPDGMECLHEDGNPDNNTVGNLAWGTRSENERDKLRHGTHYQASKTHCPYGHEFTPENTYQHVGRACRICAARRRATYEKKTRAAK